jgi:succinylglutamate desuccinylase
MAGEMDKPHDLFDGEADWLQHTLKHADRPTPSKAIALEDGTRVHRLDTGVLKIQPCQTLGDECLIVSAGIHGNETAPIEVLNQLVSELVNGRWQAALPTLLILGNPPAMANGERFTRFNLNRLFSGAHAREEYAGSDEAIRAKRLEDYCREFAGYGKNLLHYDLHTAIRPSHREKFALYPFVSGRAVPDSQRNFLLAADVHTLLLQHKAGTTFSSFSSSELGAESFTIELGKVRPFGQNDLERFDGIERALRRLMSGQTAPSEIAENKELTIFEVVHEILNTGEHFQFHVPDDVANFTPYEPGTVIWEDAETCYQVGDVTESIIFPNRQVPVGQRVGLLVRPKTRG